MYKTHTIQAMGKIFGYIVELSLPLQTSPQIKSNFRQLKNNDQIRANRVFTKYGKRGIYLKQNMVKKSSKFDQKCVHFLFQTF